MIPSLEDMARLMHERGVRYIVIGGWAAIMHGIARTTNDVDLVYARDPDNIRNLAAALQAHLPYLRGAPPGLPFRWDEATIRAGLNFTLTTSLGAVDLLGEVSGGGSYEELLPFTTESETFGFPCRFVTLEKLI